MFIGNDILPRSFGNPDPVWIPAPGGVGTITYLTHTAGTSTNSTSVTTPSADTTGANFIIVSVSSFAGAGEPTLSDSNGNTWTGLTAQTGAVLRQRLFYCVAPSVGAGHTFTVSGASSFPALAVEAFSGVNATPFGTQNGATDAGGTINTGSVTPSVANSLLVTGLAFNSPTATTTIDSSFIKTDSTTPTPSDGVGAAMAYKITSGAENPQWVVTSGTSGTSTSIATFTPA